MKWTSVADLRQQVQKRWDKGEWLRDWINGPDAFPKQLTFKTPNATDMTQHFEAVRKWIAEIRAIPHCRIEMREFSHRVLGHNTIPHTIWIESIEDALAWIGKQREATRFSALFELTRQQQPILLPWLAKRPLRALEYSNMWPSLLEVITWLQHNPKPKIFLRQIDLPGVHSKFLEAHRGILTELLDIALPAEAINSEAVGVSQFAARYGFLDKPTRIRFRILDSKHAFFPAHHLAQDVTLDAESFAALRLSIQRVFITENETNFLAFPALSDSLIIFGAGYGWEALGQAHWLSNCAIYYWGDIDTHGFAILNQLRHRFAHVQSLLMDVATFMAHSSLWGHEDAPMQHDLPLLTADESALFDDLRDNRLGKQLRLEQEQIGFQWLQAALAEGCY